MMNMAVCSSLHTPTLPLFEQLCGNGVTLPETLERIRPCQLETERTQMMTGCKSILSRKARGRPKANTKSRKEIARPTRPTRAPKTSTLARTTGELDIGRKTAKDQVEERTTIPPVTTAPHRKARTTRKAKVKAHVDVVETHQPSETASTVSYPSQTQSTIGELSCSSNVEPWTMVVTINSVSTRRPAGAEYLLLDSGAQLHACPIKYPGTKKVPLLDPGIHTASGARLQHDGGRLVTYELPEGRTIRVLVHACAVQKPILSLGCLAQEVYWSDLRADTGTLLS